MSFIKISNDNIYLRPFIISCMLHALIILFLLAEPSSKNPVLENNNITMTQNIEKTEIINAVSVDQQEVNNAIEEIKLQQQKKQQAEIARQNQLKQQALAIEKKRIAEENKIKKLKIEAEKIAIAKKKQIEENKKQLQALENQKKQEQQKISELKKKATLEKLNNPPVSKKSEAIKNTTALEKPASTSAQNNTEPSNMAGEVDKYKALILNAISKNWILPDTANPNLSSKFNIKLDSSGRVIEVKLLISSGDKILDRSAEAAIFKASPLPVPRDPKIFALFREISLTVRPENAVF